MQVKILFDNDALNNKFSMGWGFSCIIDNSILFDTGEDSEYLFNNMKKMNIDISNIEAVVISHDHWDHTRGLWGLLKIKNNIIVHICSDFDDSFRKNIRMLDANIVEHKDFYQIRKNIYITGEMSVRYRNSYISEQALVIKTPKGISIITGCAHPGILKILDKVKYRLPKEKIYLVLGGFHLLEASALAIKKIADGFKSRGVKKIGPAHCTGTNATKLFKEEYKTNFIEAKIGQSINI